MADCKSSDDAFALAARSGTPMNVVAVVQHTAAEYLGLMEDHLEGRRIRFQYFRPFAAGALPDATLPADALLLLGGGPWGTAGARDLPTLKDEVDLTRQRLAEGTPVIGIGIGAQILAIAAGGGSESTPLVFEAHTARRVVDDALNGFLPAEFLQLVYMRDRPVLPDTATVLAMDDNGAPAVFRIGDNAYGFLGHPGLKVGMVEDLVMEFEEGPENLAQTLATLRAQKVTLEDQLVPIMTGLVQCTQLMSAPRAGGTAGANLDA